MSAEKTRVELYPSPWEPETNRIPPIEPLTAGMALKRLEFSYPDIPHTMLDSIIASEWASIDNGRMYLEVRNPDFFHKSGSTVYLTDFDDCVLSTTDWHNREYELVSQCPELCAQQIEISPAQAKDVYEISKILIPGKVEHEPRYTPRLNLILLTHIANQLGMGIAPEVVWDNLGNVRDAIVIRVARQGEGELGLMRVDERILKLFQENSPAQYLQKKFMDELHRDDADEFHIIVTRGKPEGLLGQIYKLHTSGALEKSVDIVLYTNDIKAEALIQLSRMVPWMKSSPIVIYDDNPNEVLPYLRFIHQRNIDNIDLVHVRHNNSKRRDLIVEGYTPTDTILDGETLTKFDQYHPGGRRTICFRKNPALASL
jgi:hypothetical protein